MITPPPLRDDCFALPAGVDWMPVKTALALLKEKLTESHYDIVRQTLGLLPLKEAVKKGQEINGEINKNIDVK